MSHDATLTVRVPAALKHRIEARALGSHRSVSAQVLHDLEAVAGTAAETAAGGRFLGLFPGPVPTDAHISAVRTRLWRRLRRPRRHA